MNTYVIPASNVRPGDYVELSPGDNREVIESHSYMGIPGPLDGSWTIVFRVSDAEWPIEKYRSYHPTDEDGNDFYPEDCIDTRNYPEDDLLTVSVSDSVLLHPETLLPIRWWVAVYEVDRGFGGHEEGGWWFDTGELRVSVPCQSQDEADAVAARLRETWTNNGRSSSVIYGGGDYRVWVERDQPAESFPESTPHYS